MTGPAREEHLLHRYAEAVAACCWFESRTKYAADLTGDLSQHLRG